MKMIRPKRLRCMLREARWATRNAPVEVRVDDVLEPLLGHPHEERVLGDPGVGHQHLDRTLVLLDLFERPVDGVVVGDVAHDAEQALGRPGSAVGDGHLVPVGRQALRDGQADPPVSTGDQYGTGNESGPAAGSAVVAVSETTASLMPANLTCEPSDRRNRHQGCCTCEFTTMT